MTSARDTARPPTCLGAARVLHSKAFVAHSSAASPFPRAAPPQADDTDVPSAPVRLVSPTDGSRPGIPHRFLRRAGRGCPCTRQKSLPPRRAIASGWTAAANGCCGADAAQAFETGVHSRSPSPARLLLFPLAGPAVALETALPAPRLSRASTRNLEPTAENGGAGVSGGAAERERRRNGTRGSPPRRPPLSRPRNERQRQPAWC